MEEEKKEKPKKDNLYTKIERALSVTFKDFVFRILAVSFTLNFIALDYIILTQSTTFRILFSQNTAFYNIASITLSLITAILFGLAIALIVYVLKKRKEGAKEAASSGTLGAFFGAIASGCPVCGAWLLPLFGIAGSLAAFPFQGLEIKLIAIALLIFSISQSANSVLGLCKSENKTSRLQTTVIILLVAVIALLILPNISSQFKFKFQKEGITTPNLNEKGTLNTDAEELFDQVNPKKGFKINVNYGNIGYRLVEDGVIDFDKFKALYDRSGTPLTREQLRIFTEDGLNRQIVINRENSYFLLNLFWAFGLANENPILTEGEITKYSRGKVGGFASTGGWTIAKKPLLEYFAKSNLAPLTAAQQARLQKVAENVYRPCCGNSTAFPDCNHGMALLGVLELMASNGATEDEMFEASKYFTAFWFPQQFLDLATFFKIKDGVDFKDIDARTIVSKGYASGQGWSRIKGWLNSNVESGQNVAPQGGGGCGVESGAPSNTNTRQPSRSQQIVPQGGGGCGV